MPNEIPVQQLTVPQQHYAFVLNYERKIINLALSTPCKEIHLNNIIANGPLIKLPDHINYGVSCKFFTADGFLNMNATPIPDSYQFKSLNTVKIKKSLDPGISKVTRIKIEGSGFHWEDNI